MFNTSKCIIQSQTAQPVANGGHMTCSFWRGLGFDLSSLAVSDAASHVVALFDRFSQPAPVMSVDGAIVTLRFAQVLYKPHAGSTDTAALVMVLPFDHNFSNQNEFTAITLHLQDGTVEELGPSLPATLTLANGTKVQAGVCMYSYP